MFHRMTAEKWIKVMSVTLNALFNVTQPVYSHMRQNKRGKNITILSVNGHKGQIGQVNYAATKSAVYGFTKSLALEGAAFGVTVNSVSPGYIDSKMINVIRDDIKEQIKQTILVKSFGQATDIADTIRFLVEGPSHITEEDISVNGDLYLKYI